MFCRFSSVSFSFSQVTHKSAAHTHAGERKEDKEKILNILSLRSLQVLPLKKILLFMSVPDICLAMFTSRRDEEHGKEKAKEEGVRGRKKT